MPMPIGSRERASGWIVAGKALSDESYVAAWQGDWRRAIARKRAADKCFARANQELARRPRALGAYATRARAA